MPNPIVCLTRIEANLFKSEYPNFIPFVLDKSESKSLEILKKTCLVLSGSVNSSAFGPGSIYGSPSDIEALKITTSGQTTTAIVLGGSGDNSFDNVWGEIILSSAGGSTNVIIDGYIS